MPGELPDVRDLEGAWLHSSGGTVVVRREGEDLAIDSPHASAACLVPISSFIRPDGLHFFQHVGTLREATISWSNGAVWTRQEAGSAPSAAAPDADAGRAASAAPRFLVVRGRVQNVMFRQTLIRAMQARGIDGGATNDPADKSRVDLTMVGGSEEVGAIVDALRRGMKLNSWGAQASSVEEPSAGLRIEDHQVTTRNVDTFSWNPKVQMYL